MSGDLETLLAEGIITEVGARLKSGKEADVWIVAYGGRYVAAKVYKDHAMRSFKNNSGYKEGRSVRNTRSARAIERGSRFGRDAAEDAWKSAEVDALYKLHAGGVRVPTPVLYYEGVLLMELVLDPEGGAAPRVIDSPLTAEDANKAYHDMLGQLVRILCCDLIHGDLSPYNVLWGVNGPTIIDFPQAVSAPGNSRAEFFFIRDAHNILGHFARIDRSLDGRVGDAAEIWRAYTRRELSPDFLPRGRPMMRMAPRPMDRRPPMHEAPRPVRHQPPPPVAPQGAEEQGPMPAQQEPPREVGQEPPREVGQQPPRAVVQQEPPQQDSPHEAPQHERPREAFQRDRHHQGPADRPRRDARPRVDGPPRHEGPPQQQRRDSAPEQQRRDRPPQQPRRDSFPQQQRGDASPQQPRRDAFPQQPRRDAIPQQPRRDAFPQQPKQDAPPYPQRRDAPPQQRRDVPPQQPRRDAPTQQPRREPPPPREPRGDGPPQQQGREPRRPLMPEVIVRRKPTDPATPGDQGHAPPPGGRPGAPGRPHGDRPGDIAPRRRRGN